MIGLKIVGWGAYRPRYIKHSTEIDQHLGKETGWVEANFGIISRHVAAEDETSSMMAAQACKSALDVAKWDAGAFDVMIGACGVMEQPIPSTSILVQEKLGLGQSGIPAFDVNQTCLSFMQALDIAAMGIKAGRWKRVLVFSSDIASAGLDPDVPKTFSIFGDGAAAIAIEASKPNETSGLLASNFESYGRGFDLAQLRSGGTRLRIEEGYEALKEGSFFEMDAFGIFKAAAKCLPSLIDKALEQAGVAKADLKSIICHQASAPGVEHVRRLFAPDSDRVINIFPEVGNQIAASIPTVLCHSLTQGLVNKGDDILLLGTAAGISAGAMVIRV